MKAFLLLLTIFQLFRWRNVFQNKNSMKQFWKLWKFQTFFYSVCHCNCNLFFVHVKFNMASNLKTFYTKKCVFTLSNVVICPYLAFQTCQSRIILALKNYTRIFNKNGVFKNSACSKWRGQANKVADVTGDLLRLLEVCLFLFKNLCYCFMNTSFWYNVWTPATNKGHMVFPHPYQLSSWKVSYVNYCCIGFSSKHF